MVCSVCMKHFEMFAAMDIFKLFLAIHRMQKLTQECLNWAYLYTKRIKAKMGWNECHIYPSREERHDDSQAVEAKSIQPSHE